MGVIHRRRERRPGSRGAVARWHTRPARSPQLTRGAPPEERLSMRPRLKPALRRVARDGRTLQFGLHPRHAVVLTDLEPEVRRWVESLDGVRDLAGVLAGAAEAGLGEEGGRTLLDLLVSRGVVDDAGAGPGPLRTLAIGRARPAPAGSRRALPRLPARSTAGSPRWSAGERPRCGSTARAGWARRSSPCSPPRGSATSASSIPVRPGDGMSSPAGSAGRRWG